MKKNHEDFRIRYESALNPAQLDAVVHTDPCWLSPALEAEKQGP